MTFPSTVGDALENAKGTIVKATKSVEKVIGDVNGKIGEVIGSKEKGSTRLIAGTPGKVTGGSSTEFNGINGAFTFCVMEGLSSTTYYSKI